MHVCNNAIVAYLVHFALVLILNQNDGWS